MKNLSKIITGLLFFSLLFEANAQVCNNAGKGNAMPRDQSKLCAPSEVNWNIYYFGLNPSRTNEVVIDWGDGSVPEVATLVCLDPTGPPVMRKYETTATHIYPKGDGECIYQASVYLRVDGQACDESEQIQNVIVWDTDDVLGQGLLTNVDEYEVCAGNTVTVNFTDVTQFTCLATDHPYNVGRWIQWEYGTDNTITGDVEIDGAVKGLPHPGDIVWLPKTSTSSGVQTLDITVPNTSVTGEYFELTLHNWNSCNPYEDEFGNPTGNSPVSRTVYIRIVDAPDAGFSVDNNPACVNNPVQFTNTSTAGLQYHWDFGDGTTSTATHPSKTYSAVGNYTVTLTVTNDQITGNTGSCFTTISKDIEILPQPVADFSIDPAAAQCQNTDVDLTNTSTNVPAGTTWKWEIRKSGPTGQLVDLNGNNTGGFASINQHITTRLPYFGAAATATYYVRLIANTPNACEDESDWKAIVRKADVGTPNFSSPLLTRCQGSGTTQYTATASFADSYDWELTPVAAGTINSTGEVSWNAGFSGTATVKVTAKGCGTDKSKSVNVDVTPVVGDPTSITGDTEICQGTASGTYTTSAANATSYTWTISGAGNTISGTTSSATVTWDPDFVGTATITVKAHGCDSESTPYTTTVEVKPTPQLSNGASDYSVTICSGETAEFIPAAALGGSSFKWSTTVTGPVTGVTGTGNNQSIGTDKISDVSINSGTTVGTVTYHITPYKDGCEGDTKDFTVTVSPGKPDDAGAIAGTDELCEKETGINFNVPDITNADDYVWTLPTGATISAGNNTKSITVDFTGTTPGDYTIEVYGENSCGAGLASTFDIEIKPRPVLTATAADAEICHEEEAVVSLSSDLPGTLYSWSVISKGADITGGSDVNNANVTEIRQQLSNSGTTPQTLTYRITPIYDGCEGNHEDITFTINPSPDVTISPAATSICDGDQTDITLSSSVAGTTYTWIATVADPSSLTGASDGSGNKINQTLVNSSTTLQTVKYTVTPTANGCDGPSEEVTITVQPTPVLATTVAASTICSEDDIDISLSSNVTGTTYSWTVITSNAGLTGAADGSGNTIQQTLENSTATAQTVIYTITPHINGCDGASQDVTITVNPKPSLTVNAAASQLCSTDETDISLTSDVSGTDFAWTVTVSDPAKLSGAAAGTGASIKQVLTNTGNTAQTVTYHITTEANGCAGESKDITITVHPTPVLTLTPVKTELCSGEEAKINFSSTVASTTYTWTVTVSDPAKLSGAFSGAGNSISQVLTNSGTTQEQVTYSVTPTANGCVGAVEEVTITVNPPISEADAGADDAICGLSYLLTATPPAVGTGKWTVESGSGTVTFVDDTDPHTQVTVSDFGDYTFRWTLTHGSCGTDVDFVDLTFKNAPATSDILGKAEVCVNTENVLYQVVFHNNSTYAWSLNTVSGTAPTVKFGGGPSDNLISLDFGNDAWSGELVVIETNDGCTADPKKIAINSYQLPVAHAGNDQTICAGSSVTLGEAPSASGGSGSYTYSWLPIIGLDDPNAANPTATPNFTRTYSLKVTDANTGCVSASDNVTITVEPQLQAGSIIGTQTICEGTVPTAFTENPATGGDGNYTYQWEKSTDGGVTYNVIPLANAALYEETAPLTATTLYRRKVTGGVCGEKITTPIEVTVEPALVAGAIGSDQTIVAGSTPAKLTSITDAQGGSGLQYKWQKATGTGTNYTDIPGATDAEYQPGPLSVTTFFRRVAYGGVCTPVESNIVTITVEASSEAGTIEDNQVICINTTPEPIKQKDPASGGTGTYAYRWLFSEDGVNFTVIPGETGIDYTPAAPLTVTTYYKREVQSGVAPWVSSNVITVTVEEELNPGIIAGNQTICQGGNPVAFTEDTAPAGGSGTYTYRWKQSASATGPFDDISGAIFPTYDVPAGLNSTTYYVREVSGGKCQPRLSNVLEVFVEPTLTGGTIDGSQTICYNGDPTAFGSTAAPTGGDGTYTYQWQEKVGSGTFVDIPGADQITYDVSSGIEYTTTYRRKVTSGACAAAYSNDVKVTVEPTLYPGSIAGAQTVCENADPAEISSIAAPSGGAGTGTYLYQWKSSNDMSGTFTAISGATSPSYDPPAGITETTYYVREVTSGSCGPESSNIITITVEPTLLAGTIDGTTTICQGDTPVPFGSVAAASGGNGSLVYQWEWSYTQGGPYTEVPGANSETYQVATVMNTTTYYVRKVTAGVCDAQYSNEIKVTVEPTINPGSIGGDQIICEDDIPAAFSQNPATGGSGSYSYQWEYAADASGPFQDIVGATSATYQVTTPMSATTFFRRKVTAGVCDEKYTNTIKVTVQPTLTPGSVSADQTIPANTAPQLFNEDTAPEGGSGSYLYQWKYATDINGPYAIILGANDPTYQAGSLPVTTYFIREVRSGQCPPVASDPITVIVEPASAAGAIGAHQVICAGSVPEPLKELSPATGGTGTYEYKWQFSTDPNTGYTDIADTDSEGFTPTEELTVTTYYRRAVKSGVSDFVYTSPVQITVQETLTAGVIGTDETICYNGDPALFNEISPASGGSGLYYYQWKSSTTQGGPYDDIPLATNKLYDVPAGLDETTYYVREVSSGECGSVLSNEIKVTVEPTLTAGKIGGTQTICEGAPPSTLTEEEDALGGTGTYEYQWKYSTTPGGPYLEITGADQAEYTPDPMHQTTYFVRVVRSAGGECAEQTSNEIAVIVEPTLQAGQIQIAGSNSKRICEGDVAEEITSVSAPSGGNTVSYTFQWKHSLVSGGPYTDIPGAIDATYNPPDTLTLNAYYVREVSSGFCDNAISNEVHFIVDPTLNPGTISADQTIVVGGDPEGFEEIDPVSGGSGSYSIQWESSPDTVSANFTVIAGATSNVYDVPSGLLQTTYYRRRVQSGVCGFAYSNLLKVTVESTLTSGTIGDDQVICEGSIPEKLVEITPTTGGNGVYTYQWKYATDPNGPFEDVEDDLVEDPEANELKFVQGLSSTTYFKREVHSGVYDPVITDDYVTIFVQPLLTAGSIKNVGMDEICLGEQAGRFEEENAPEGGDGDYEYQWLSASQPGGPYQEVVGAIDPDYQSPLGLASTTYYVRRVRSGECQEVFSNELAVIVNPLPDVSMTSSVPDNIICDGTEVTFTAAGANEYEFYLNGISVQGPSSNNIYVTDSLVTMDEVYVLGTDVNGCQALSNSIVTIVNDLPTATIVGTADICAGSQTSLILNMTGKMPFEVVYSDGSEEFTLKNQAYESILNVKPSVSTTYSLVSVKDANGCAQQITDQEAVVNVGHAVAQFSVIGASAACSPHTLTFVNEQIQEGVTYTWAWGDGTEDVITTADDPAIIEHTFINYTSSRDMTYQVTLIATHDSIGCTDRASTSVHVYPAPEIRVEYDPQIGCGPLLVHFINNSFGAETHRWYYRVKGTNAVLDERSSKSVSYILPNTTSKTIVYEVVYEASSDKCMAAPEVFEVTVYPELKPYFTVTPPQQHLPNSTVHITNLTNAGDWDYFWDFGDGTTSTERDPGAHTYGTYGQFYITLTVTNNGCEKQYEERVIIDINPDLPFVEFRADSHVGCGPLTVTFTNESNYIDPATFQWDFGDGTGAFGVQHPVHTYDKPGKYSVKLEAVNIFGEHKLIMKEFLVEVYEQPRAIFSAGPPTVYLPDRPIGTINQSVEATSYEWNFGDGTISNEFEPTHIYTEAGVYDVMLVAFNDWGCSDTLLIERLVSVKQPEAGKTRIPNSFTPDPAGPSGGNYQYGDVSNDIFIPMIDGITEMSMTIYNRWGKVMFSSHDKNVGWDGYYQGELCPADVYYYKLEMKFSNGERKTEYGDVTLIR